jgi:hypothetical protein
MPTSPQKLVSWSEPSFFKRQACGCIWPPAWGHVVFALLTALFSSLLIWMPPKNPSPEDYFTVPLIGVVCGGILGYGLTLFDQYMPAQISIDRNGVGRIDTILSSFSPLLRFFKYRTRSWSWQQISEAQFEEFPDKRLVGVIALYDENHSLLGLIGVTPSTELQTVKACFAENGVPFLNASE